MQINPQSNALVDTCEAPLEYANQVWDPYFIKDIKLLEDVQKFACKVCLKNWNMPYNEMLDTLNMPKVEQRIERDSISALCTNLFKPTPPR